MNDDRGRRRDDEPGDDAELDPSAWLSGQFDGDDSSDGSSDAEPDDGDDPATRALPVVDPVGDEGQEARVEPGGPVPPAVADHQGEVPPAEPRDGGAPSSQPVVVPPPAPDPPRAEGHPQALDLAALRAAVDPGARPPAPTPDDAGASPGHGTAPGPGTAPARPSTSGRDEGPDGEASDGEGQAGAVPGPFTALIASQAVPGAASAEPVAFDWDKVRSVARQEPGTARLDLPVASPTGPEAPAASGTPVASDDAPEARPAGDGDAVAGPAAAEPALAEPALAEPALAEPAPADAAPAEQLPADAAPAEPAPVETAPVGPAPVEPEPESSVPESSEPEGPAAPAEPWWVDEHREMTRRERRLAEAAGLSVPPAVAPSADTDTDTDTSTDASAEDATGVLAAGSSTGSDDVVDREGPDEDAAAAPIALDGDPAPAGASGSWSLSSDGDPSALAATGDVVLDDADLPGSSRASGPSVPQGDDARTDAPSTGLATGWPFATPGAVDPASDAPLTTPRDEPSFTELLGIVPPPAASEADRSPSDDASAADRDEDELGDEELVDDAVADDVLVAGAPLDADAQADVGRGAGDDVPEDGTGDARAPEGPAPVVDEDDESEGIDDPVPGAAGDAPGAVVPAAGAAPTAFRDAEDEDRADAEDEDRADADADADADHGAPVDPPTAVLGAPVAAASASAAPGPGSAGEPLGLVPTGVVPAPVSRSAPATERDDRPREATPAGDALPGVSASSGGATGGTGRASGAPGGRRRPIGAEVEAWARQHVVLLAVVAGVVLLLALVALFFLSRGIAGAAAAGSAQGAATAVAEPSPTVTRTVTAEPVAPVEEPVVAGPLAAGVHSWQDLQGGECLAAFPDAWQQEYEVVDCAATHAAQLTALVQLEGDAASAWPGLDALQAEVPTRCSADGALDRGAAGAYTGVQLSASYPATAEDWAAGDRRYACFVSREGAQPLTTSLAPAAG